MHHNTVTAHGEDLPQWTPVIFTVHPVLLQYIEAFKRTDFLFSSLFLFTLKYVRRVVVLDLFGFLATKPLCLCMYDLADNFHEYKCKVYSISLPI